MSTPRIQKSSHQRNQMASEFVKKQNIFIFTLFLILLHFIFFRFQLLQSILWQWNSSKDSSRISDHKSTRVWIFETSKPYWFHCACSMAKRKSILDSTKSNGSFTNLLLIMRCTCQTISCTGHVEEVRFIFFLLISLLYARDYNPWFLYFLPHF